MEKSDKYLKSFYLSKLPQDIFKINTKIYWLDLLICIFIGWTAFITLGKFSHFSILFILCYLISVFALYRAVGFIHEICHQQNNSKFIKSFSFVWHITVGIPLLFPSFLYYCHLFHHHHKIYKTYQDPQYIPIKNNPLAIVQVVLLKPILMPLILIKRFLILAPLSIIFPSMREEVESQFSSIARNDYVAKFNNRQKKEMKVVEIMILFWILIISYCFLNLIIPSSYFFLWYLVLVSILILNFFRALGEHTLDGLSESSLSLEEELLDSYTYPHGGWRQLMFVPGLRYHALHHLFPGIPYHNLPKGHKILFENLPKDDLYIQTEKEGLLYSVKQLIQ